MLSDQSSPLGFVTGLGDRLYVDLSFFSGATWDRLPSWRSGRGGDRRTPQLRAGGACCGASSASASTGLRAPHFVTILRLHRCRPGRARAARVGGAGASCERQRLAAEALGLAAARV